MPKFYDFTVPNLGPAKIPSPIEMSLQSGRSLASYVSDDDYVLYEVNAKHGYYDLPKNKNSMLQLAGPRKLIYFNPSHVHAGIVTCGGLCPGLNDVIRSIVRTLWYRYAVQRISGIRNGYNGFLADYGFEPIVLNPSVVDDIHKMGGTMLGSSRGGGKRTEDIVDAIERMNLNMLFVIGGDGTQKGALALAEEIEKRSLKIAIIGIPKTIDNDLNFIQKSFGFETAVAKACEAVKSAHTEAHSTINGIGLVKLMGRESGFIAAHTALSVHEANFVLIPEVPFDIDGSNGLLNHLQHRLGKRQHAVIIVAEGAGQEHMQKIDAKDASGNAVFSDIGVYLKKRIQDYFQEQKMEVNVKYIDPSYMIRSQPAEPNDAFYCSRLGTNAVHAAMTGKTKTLISLVNNHFVHLPIELTVATRNHVDPESSLWRDVIEATRQPALMKN